MAKSHHHFDFEIVLPNSWRHEETEDSLTILMVIDELLKITLPESDTRLPVSILIHLQQDKNAANLKINITYAG